MKKSLNDFEFSKRFQCISLYQQELLELEEQNGKVSRGLDQEIIDNLPIVKFTNRLKQQQERCTICISDFEVGEELKQLPCRHIYHLECVDSWLK
jgi:hypothetical protein